MTTNQFPPKLLILNDMAGVGRCSMSVSLPVVSACKVQAIPVPTSVFSNHTGFPTHFKKDLTDSLADYLAHLNLLTISWDGLYCGYLGSLTQMQIITSYYQSLSYKPFLMIDPVMGDHGKAYQHITPAFCHAMKDFLHSASVITPNLTEACLLTDTPYPGASCDRALLDTLIVKLAALGPSRIIITGIEQGDNYVNYISDEGTISVIQTKKAGPGYPGTGDIFASITASFLLRGYALSDCVSYAARFVADCISYSTQLHASIPQGVIFEPLLSELMKH